jgi:molybdopterin synthase catalytic subunit
MAVRVQEGDFDVGAELDRLTKGNKRIGGLAVFVGLVREMHVREGLHRDRIDALTLEHYPGMTEKALEGIVAEARARWDVIDILIVHRVGEIRPTEQIVLVAVAGAHRGEAFAACEFVMDYLKTRAPFWKQEQTPQGARWVEARESDDQAAERWTAGKSDAA